MRTWLAYLKLGKRIYRLLKQRFPLLTQVPIEDILSVVEELITTTATLEQVRLVQETPTQLMASGSGTPDYRLVLETRKGTHP